MDYLETVNAYNFKEASLLVHQAKELLIQMGMTEDTAYNWITAWASGAGDGSE